MVLASCPYIPQARKISNGYFAYRMFETINRNKSDLFLLPKFMIFLVFFCLHFQLHPTIQERKFVVFIMQLKPKLTRRKEQKFCGLLWMVRTCCLEIYLLNSSHEDETENCMLPVKCEFNP